MAAAAPNATVLGIDYSADSVAAAQRFNRELIAQGRVAIQQASVDDLPFQENRFDLVTAVETHFWWADLAAGLLEIFRVMKPGARVVIIAESTTVAST